MVLKETEKTTKATNRQYLTAWKKLQEVKRTLIKEGILNGDATAVEIMEAIRSQIPEDML